MCYFWGKIGALMEKTSEIRKMNRPTNECIFWNKICPLFLPKFQVFRIFLTNLSMGGYSPQRISIYSQIVLNIWLNEGCQKHCIFKLAFYKFTVNSVYSYYCWIQLIFRWIQFWECMMLLYNFMRSKKNLPWLTTFISCRAYFSCTLTEEPLNYVLVKYYLSKHL